MKRTNIIVENKRVTRQRPGGVKKFQKNSKSPLIHSRTLGGSYIYPTLEAFQEMNETLQMIVLRLDQIWERLRK